MNNSEIAKNSFYYKHLKNIAAILESDTKKAIELRRNIIPESLFHSFSELLTVISESQQTNNFSELHNAAVALYNALIAHQTISNDFNDLIEILRTSIDEIRKIDDISIRDGYKRQLDIEMSNIRDFYQTQIKLLTDKLDSLQIKINETEKSLSDKVEPIAIASKEAEDEITRLTSNIRSLASQKSGDIIYGDYQASATDERTTSNRFRNYSIYTMIFAVVLAIFFYIDSKGTNLTISAIAIKITVFLLLSVPAAYFARESAKHRRQQYLYQQYALNLDALAPFIAELPDDSKHQLKSELARTLFTSSHEISGAKDDPYPINTQELLVLLLNKMEFKTTGK